MRLLPSAAVLCLLVLGLTGCGQGDPVPTETMLTMPASPSPQPSAAAPPGGVADAQRATTAPEASAHCVIVAGGMTTAMLAPLTLLSGSDPDELRALEQQILDLRDKVPEDLHDDFTTLALSVEAPPEGSGTFDEEAFRHAMVPVQDWLGRHCTES
ncbi:hypothetical protein [Arthrobacter antioxidans]|uniref:hypothetical protein n=1 Tax=Arthrobacter antioxidans TaxID=2895818 RepID=UPI001FFF9FE6|nr:hypothetical protein [Arthrobacter antioxidans]